MKQLLSMAALAALVSFAAAPAQAADKSGYLTDKAGNIVTSKTTGLCIRSKEWSSSTADSGCMAKAKGSK